MLEPQLQFAVNIIGVFLDAVIGAWVVYDALTRGKQPWQAFWWGVGAWILWIVFVPLWFWLRPPLGGRSQSGNRPGYNPYMPPYQQYPQNQQFNATPLCRYCGKPSGDDPFYCAACGRQLKGVGDAQR